jgi:hypothetical protein
VIRQAKPCCSQLAPLKAAIKKIFVRAISRVLIRKRQRPKPWERMNTDKHDEIHKNLENLELYNVEGSDSLLIFNPHFDRQALTDPQEE